MPQVLSIQSHVIHGYVGNRAATFPLQLRGWDVDALNTVSYSNHTGYGSFTGFKTSPEQLREQYEGLKAMAFPYDGLLTGYCPTPQALEAVEEIGADLASRNPALQWIVDPVMGDVGTIYVQAEVIPIYRRILATQPVTLTTPNGYEAELLTEVQLKDKASICQALDIFHTQFKVPNVVVTSINVGDRLYALGSSAGKEPFMVKIEAIDGYFTGTGDMFASLLFDNFYKFSRDGRPDVLERTVLSALDSIHQVLRSTDSWAREHGSEGSQRGDPEKMKHRELRIIPNRHVIMNAPDVKVNVLSLDEIAF